MKIAAEIAGSLRPPRIDLPLGAVPSKVDPDVATTDLAKDRSPAFALAELGIKLQLRTTHTCTYDHSVLYVAHSMETERGDDARR